MARQHATPLLVSDNVSVSLSPFHLTGDGRAVSEAEIQALVQAHPECLPILEIDPVFAQPVPICTELNTRAGPIDNLLVTASGLPVLVECKLWRNPEGRREVVGQILDYAKELSRWTASDLQREASRRCPSAGNPLLERVRAAGHQVDEAMFNDALTLNLRRGRFLLLIVGDGIREGVEAIAEYLQAHAGLHFTFGLVEMPIYRLPNDAMLVVPRVLARTTLITREVVAVPEGFTLSDIAAGDPEEAAALSEDDAARRRFMLEVVDGLILDDPDQPTPRVSPKGWLFLYLPAPASSCWIGVLYKASRHEIGIRLTSNAGSVGEAAIRLAVQEWQVVKEQIGGDPRLDEMSPGRFRVEEFRALRRADDGTERAQAVAWVQERLRSYVAVFRPRIREAVQQIREVN